MLFSTNSETNFFEGNNGAEEILQNNHSREDHKQIPPTEAEAVNK